jgi:hypothetical protein
MRSDIAVKHLQPKLFKKWAAEVPKFTYADEIHPKSDVA